MHTWNADLELLSASVIGYASERAKLPKDPRWGARDAQELAEALTGAVSQDGVGGQAALELFRDVLLPACRPMDDPMMVSYVPTAPTIAAVLFDMVVSASSIFAGHWESGAGAIAAENQALRWIMDIAGFPASGGGCFVSGGTAANLAALVTARQHWRSENPDDDRRNRLAIVATHGAHASVDVIARVMDVDFIRVRSDPQGRMTADELAHALEDVGDLCPFAVVTSAGTTNSGAIDDLTQIAPLCRSEGLWLHVDAAYGGSVLASPTHRHVLAGIELADSFGIDPHKWLFAPYDCAAVLYRNPTMAAHAHAQQADYLDYVDDGEWNPSDYALHLTRRARGLPLWFSLAANGTDAYAKAIDTTMEVAAGLADRIRESEEFDLLVEPKLSIVLFRRRGWAAEDYERWSRVNAESGTALIVPSKWEGEICFRICIVNPLTDLESLDELLEDMAASSARP